MKHQQQEEKRRSYARIKVAIAGAGSRGKDCYAPCARRYPEDMEIVAVADPRRENVEEMAQAYGIPPENCFSSAEEMLAQPKLADVMFICTMDRMHVDHAVAAMRKGYDLLLEKPVAIDMEGCLTVSREAKACGRQVVVCHVLRYTPFYQTVRDIIASGRLGELSTVHAFENIGYYHYAHSYVRGNWRNSNTTSPMILAKSCHDMDILLWLTGKRCKRLSSFGSLREFRKEKAPAGASARCLDGACSVKAQCPYDAEKIYLDPVHSGNLGWPANIVVNAPTADSLTRALEEGPYGRCVYHCDNNVVDHQVVNLEMEDGVTVSLTVWAYSNRIYRQIKVMGTRGELEGDMDSNKLRVWEFGKEPETTDIAALETDLSGHGGGDYRMVRDVLDLLQGKGPDLTTLTSIDRSLESHLAAFAAEYSRLNNGAAVDLDTFIQGGRELNSPAAETVVKP